MYRLSCSVKIVCRTAIKPHILSISASSASAISSPVGSSRIGTISLISLFLRFYLKKGCDADHKIQHRTLDADHRNAVSWRYRGVRQSTIGAIGFNRRKLEAERKAMIMGERT